MSALSFASVHDGWPTVARLFVREDGGLVLGKVLETGTFEDGHVYLVKRVMNTLHLVDAGVSCAHADNDVESPMQSYGTTSAFTPDHLVTDGSHLYTRQECETGQIIK